MNLKKLLATVSLTALSVLFLIPQTGALDSGIEVEGIDTIAGYSALLRVSNAPSDTDLEVWVEKPDGSDVVLEATTDKYGKAKVDLEGFYTKKAGEYSVKAKPVGSREEFGSTETFTVYADSVSASRSEVEIDRSTASANGNDYIKLEVTLKDRYNNPIEGHTLNIISSRLNDDIVRISKNPYTDAQGAMLFHVYSQESGVSTFAIHDSTSDITLDDRAKIAFYAPDRSNELAAMGGDYLILAQSSSSGTVETFEIEDLDDTVKVNQTINFTVTAQDSLDQTVPDYTGTVRFSSTDSNATLPDDYEFEAEDQGTHTFSLSLSFKTTGTHTLTVTDIDDTDVYGEFVVEVNSTGTGDSSSSSDSGSSSSSSGSSSSNGGLSVTSPQAGTYSSNSLSFTGEATYGDTIQIYDDSVLISSTAVKSNGTFSYTATNLSDGDHLFLLVAVNEEGEEQERSDDIEVTTDTSGPEIDQIEVSPSGDIPADSSFTVSVYTEKNLPEVSILFNNELYDMTEDLLIDGYYEVTITAPSDLGEYEVDVILVDEIGNESSYNAAAQIVVVEAETAETENGEDSGEELYDSAPETEEEADPMVPAAVTGVEAVAGDGRVTLSWEKPTEIAEEEVVEETELSEEGLDETSTSVEEETTENDEALDDENTTDEETLYTIDHYRIYYGPDPELLYSYDDTWDSSTTWYVDGLDNDALYYFKIVAMTDDGTEGEASEVVTSTPESSEAEALYNASLEEEAAAAEAAAEEEAMEAALEEEETPETGPETVWLLALSFGFGYVYFKKRPPHTLNRATAEATPIPASNPVQRIVMMDIRRPE